MSDITKILKGVVGDPICIYNDADEPSKFKFGKIRAFNDSYTAIYEIAPNGSYDGVSVIMTDSITRIERGGQYAEKMRKLTSPESYELFPHSISNEHIREDVLSIAAKEQGIVRLEILESGIFDVIGIIERIDGGVVSVQLVDEYGYKDGNTDILLGAITAIAYCGDEERTIGRLFGINYK